MDRRDFLKTTSTLLAASAIPSVPALAAPNTAAGRTILPLNRDWRYHPSKVEGAHAADFNDSSFERVVIPHTNVKLPWHNFDDKTYEFVSDLSPPLQDPSGAHKARASSSTSKAP